MALITVVDADVAPVDVIEQFTAPADVAVARGEYVRITTTGNWILSDASAAGDIGGTRGIALNAAAIGEAVTAVLKGVVSLGVAFADQDIDDPIYLSDTAGTLADAAGTVSTVIGYVIPGNANTAPDKLLRLI